MPINKYNSMQLKRKSKTQTSQHNQHLCIELPEILPSPTKIQDSIEPIIDDDITLSTNYDVQVNNPYSFVLLHLRNRGNKNILNVNIPQVCVFVDRSPYDILHSGKGHIKGVKQNEQSKIRLKDINRYFKEMWLNKSLPKSQHSMAVFAQKQVLMLSDNDLFLVCCKTKTDPFFKKLRYLQNKIPPHSNQNPIKISFPIKDNLKLIKLATQSLMGFTNQSEIKEKLSEKDYLNYVVQKIILFLNYQQNIRVSKAIFTFIKTVDNNYYFTNVESLDFTNLTEALIRREKKLQEMQEEMNSILIMTPEKQRKYRSYENKVQTDKFQRTMNHHFNNIVRKMDFHTISDNKRQEIKNQIAFKKLHPKSKFTYNEVITATDFLKTKARLFNTPSRKPLTKPSRHVMRFYNKVRNPRVFTETIDVFK